MSSDLVIQGIAAEFRKPFVHGDKILILRSGCLNKSIRSGHDIKVLLDHDEQQCVGSGHDRLLIHAGEAYLVFRFLLPESRETKLTDKLAEMADDYSSYIPVSIGIGYNYAQTETDTIDGIKVVTVVQADLQEISLLRNAPAISSTYARVASWKTCNSLQQDYELGRFAIVGNFVSLHRKTMAHENGGVVKYSHRTSSYDRAADKFTNALRKLA